MSIWQDHSIESRIRANAERLLAAVRRLQLQGRNALEAARRQHEELRRREQRAWTDYHACRDEHADLVPPAPEAGDLSASWATLTRWAGDMAAELQAGNEQRDREISELVVAKRDAVASLRAALADHGLDADVDSSLPTADAAILTASSDVDRGRDRAEHRRNIELELDAARDKALVAAALREHLRADRFERWLLATAFRRVAEGRAASSSTCPTADTDSRWGRASSSMWSTTPTPARPAPRERCPAARRSSHRSPWRSPSRTMSRTSPPKARPASSPSSSTKGSERWTPRRSRSSP